MSSSAYRREIEPFAKNQKNYREIEKKMYDQEKKITAKIIENQSLYISVSLHVMNGLCTLHKPPYDMYQKKALDVILFVVINLSTEVVFLR